MNRSQRRIGRRTVLAGLGTAALAAPFVRLLGHPTPAKAAATGAKRFVAIFTPNGAIPASWKPEGTGTTYSFKAGSMLEPLTDLRPYIRVLSGMNNRSVTNNEPGAVGQSHANGPCGFLTANGVCAEAVGENNSGDARSISVDQYLGDRLLAAGVNTGMKTLTLGAASHFSGFANRQKISYLGRHNPDIIHNNPRNAYNAITSKIVGGGGEPPDDSERQRKLRIMSELQESYSGVRNRLGTEDRSKFDEHLDSLSELERQLNVIPVSCDSLDESILTSSNITVPATWPGANNDAKKAAENSWLKDASHFPYIVQTQMKLMHIALKCDVTRVSTLMLGSGGFAMNFGTFLTGAGGNFHNDIAHQWDDSADAYDKMVKIYRWYAEQVKFFLNLLKNTPEPSGAGGTMLDNTIILWGSEVSDASHSYMNLPWLLAGNAGGTASPYFSSGRHVQYTNAEHNNLLVSICHAMGFTDVNTFGFHKHSGPGPLSGLT